MQRDQIKGTVTRFVEALVAGDIGALLSCYDDDAVLQMPGAALIVGKIGIRLHYEQVLKIGVSHAAMEEEVYEECFGCSVETGRYVMTLTPEGQATIKDEGRYMIVYRETNGQWRIWFDMVYSDVTSTIAGV